MFVKSKLYCLYLKIFPRTNELKFLLIDFKKISSKTYMIKSIILHSRKQNSVNLNNIYISFEFLFITSTKYRTNFQLHTFLQIKKKVLVPVP